MLYRAIGFSYKNQNPHWASARISQTSRYSKAQAQQERPKSSHHCLLQVCEKSSTRAISPVLDGFSRSCSSLDPFPTLQVPAVLSHGVTLSLQHAAISQRALVWPQLCLQATRQGIEGA